MTTATLKTAAFGTAKAARTKKTKGNLLERLYNAMIDAQLRKAQREIDQHLRFVPDAVLREAGFRRTLEG